MYSYQIYKSQDYSCEKVNKAREAFGKQHLDCYVILHDGQMQMIQFEDYLPYPAATLSESARKHIESIDGMARLSERLNSDSGDTLSDDLLNEAMDSLR